LNAHAHSEQAHPRKFGRSTHTSLRRIASITHLKTWRGYASLKDGVALVFEVPATIKAAHCLERGSSKSLFLKHTKTELKTQA
jgi:hypothetical protein